MALYGHSRGQPGEKEHYIVLNHSHKMLQHLNHNQKDMPWHHTAVELHLITYLTRVGILNDL